MKLVYGPPQKYLCRENEVTPAAKNGISDADELLICTTFFGIIILLNVIYYYIYISNDILIKIFFT